MTIQRRCAALFAITFAIACGNEDSTDSTTVASASSDDTGTDPSATTSPTTSATTSPTTSATTTSAPDTSDSSSDDGPLETGPVDTGEDTAPPQTEDGSGEDTAPPQTEDGSGDDDAGGVLDMCLEMAADACEECACENCLAEVMACQADPGCVEIRMCAQENDCTGIACLGPCGDVINANGGPLGESVGLASALSDCYEAACGDC